MEADWEAAIGVGEQVIDASWPGFIDLRKAPHRIAEIEEASRFAPLAEALLRLNSGESPVWTAKCDLWTPEQWDPDEMEANPQESVEGLACYIDVLPGNGLVFVRFEEAESLARGAVNVIRKIHGRCCRVDFVIRAAVTIDLEGFGLTAYVHACGADAVATVKNLIVALSALTEAIVKSALPTSGC